VREHGVLAASPWDERLSPAQVLLMDRPLSNLDAKLRVSCSTWSPGPDEGAIPKLVIS
jgi:hypothetical protein